jgi:hypothetical protein
MTLEQYAYLAQIMGVVVVVITLVRLYSNLGTYRMQS